MRDYAAYRAEALAYYQGGGKSRATVLNTGATRQIRRARKARADKMLAQECSPAVRQHMRELLFQNNFQPLFLPD